MIKSSLVALTLFATGSVAFADDEVAPTPTPTPTPAPMAPTAGGPFGKGTLGISVGVAGAGTPQYVLDFVYFLSDKAALDILGGITLNHAAAVTVAGMTTPSSTVFGFAAGLGYRMYTHKGSTIHTYIQPYGLVAATDAGHIADTFGLQLGGNFGAEAFINDWLSFRGQVGAALAFNSTAGSTFSNIGFQTQTGLFANVYWK